MGYHQRLLLMDANSGNYDNVFIDFRLAFHDMSVHSAGLIASSTAHFGVLSCLAVVAAIFLLIIDRTNWRTNFLTALLVPYIVINLPQILFNFLRGEVGKLIAFVAVVVQLFFPNLVREKLELRAAIVILLFTLPNLVAVHFRNSMLAIIVSLVIGAYLLRQHIQAAGGFLNAFAGKKGIPVTIGILLLFVSPLWELVTPPNPVAVHFRNSILAIIVSLVISAYLLHQQIQAAGGFRNAFSGKKRVPVTIGILLLFVSPLWVTVRFITWNFFL